MSRSATTPRPRAAVIPVLLAPLLLLGLSTVASGARGQTGAPSGAGAAAAADTITAAADTTTAAADTAAAADTTTAAADTTATAPAATAEGGTLADRIAAARASATADTTAAPAAEPTLEERLRRVEERAAAMVDSLLAEGVPETIAQREVNRRKVRWEREARATAVAASGGGAPLFSGCTNTPEAGVMANVTKVNYFGRLKNSVQVRGGGEITDNYGYGYDTYRRQDKTVETRSADGTYTSGELLPFTLRLEGSINWSEDITTNSGGNTNINRQEQRRAGASASRAGIVTGPTTHTLQAGWFYNEQNAINQGQLNNFNEGEYSGGWRTSTEVLEGVRVGTVVYGIKRDGESLLADFESPSSTTGDTLGAALGYDRLGLRGRVSFDRASFDRRYLDYRRNSNGLIDTTGLEDGVSKVVRELEEQDSVQLDWTNATRLLGINLSASLAHTYDEQRYAQSGVGRKERLRDTMNLKSSFSVGADSFAVAYNYEWSWDDQQFANAVAPRGRQYKKSREITLDWQRDLFRNTRISGRYRTQLVQDIAEDEHNENDRDRLVEEGRLKLDASWSNRFTASLLTEYQRIEDISIRGTRSANNNAKRTFEVSPSYTYIFHENLQFSQTFRMYIQYQDYDFVGFEGVNKEDTYNKRGNLSTTVRWNPTDRLELDIKHDYNQKYNGTRTARDAAGNALYRRDQDQTINRIELAMVYAVVEWSQTESLKLEAATYRTRDLIERYGATINATERYSGELWVGAVVNRTFGSERPFTVKGRVKRNLAYGPNVTDTSDDYWDADVLVSWRF